MSSATLSELPEADAQGELATIYREIRHYCGVPYVSSLQRQFATLPGVLPWAWGCLRPAIVSGLLQKTAWDAVGDIDLPPLAPIPAAALDLLGVEADDIATLHAICASFSRASPVNLLFSACLLRLLAGEAEAGAGPATGDASWEPPTPTPALPAMVDAAALSDAVRQTLHRFQRGAGVQLFIPGNYRMFARWPAFLAHLAVVLPPYLALAETQDAMDGLAAIMDRLAPDILAALPPDALDRPLPAPEVRETVRGALAKYHKTSPEMVVVHRLIADALPAL